MDTYLSSPEVARKLGLQPQTLRKWRLQGLGPQYIRLGSHPRGRVLYRVADVERWTAARCFASTADESAKRAVLEVSG